MTEKTTLTRRNFLRTATGAAAGVGVLGIGAVQRASAARTRITILEKQGKYVRYHFRINSRGLRGTSLNEGSDNIRRYSSSARATGELKGGKDRYTMPGNAEVTYMWVKGYGKARFNFRYNLEGFQDRTVRIHVPGRAPSGEYGYGLNSTTAGYIHDSRANEPNDVVTNDGARNYAYGSLRPGGVDKWYTGGQFPKIMLNPTSGGKIIFDPDF